MESISTIFDQNMDVVFFFYGLAFFSMGLAVWMEAGRLPDFKGALGLLLLAGFGLIHGSHEWLEVFILLRWEEIGSSERLLTLEWIRVVLLAVSFSLLIMFGLHMITANKGNEAERKRKTVIWTAVFCGAWVVAVFAMYLLNQPCGVECFAAADVLSRYMLAIPGALLAAWAMLQQRRYYQEQCIDDCARNFAVAAVAIFLYGVIGQLFTRSSFIFPSTIINADLFRAIFGVPVQLFRGVMAAIVAIFVIRTLRALELARRQRFAAANEAKLAAQKQAMESQRRAFEQTEALNRELQTAVQDLEMLFDLSRGLARTLDRDQMLDEALSRIYNKVPRIRGGIVMLRERPDQPPRILAKAGYDQPGDHRYDPEAAVARAARVGEEVIIQQEPLCWTGLDLLPTRICPCTTGEIDPRVEAMQGRNRTLGMPIAVQEECAGSIVVSIAGGSQWLSPNDISMVQTVASQLGLAVSNAKLYEEVQAREELRGELLQQVTSAQEQERQRIARELHDSVGQRATALGLGIAAAGDMIIRDPAEGRHQLLELREMNDELILELQQLISGLRPTLLDDLGLVPAIKGQLRQLERQAGVVTRLTIDGEERRLEPELETVLFRIAQEGLNNIAKHARASLVLVRLSFGRNEIKLMIEDDGQGFDTAKVGQMEPHRRWGLLGIRERVELVGGSYVINSDLGRGTTLQVCLPLVVGNSW
ncbi:MAG: GAF domain-containing sensor histidine kinase [Candidatus Promineifilaceae bacterium]|nr:GAF domain-containing sensor histidine kinase [Candidatus Promineifilaceae bacterium]